MAKNLNIDLKNIDIKQLGELLKNINLTSLKKYSSLFPAVGLLLVAGIILIITLLVGGAVNKKMSQSVQMANEIRSKLSQVPSESEVVEEERHFQKFKEDADKVDAMAIHASLRDLICYDPIIFPEPKDTSTQIYDRFGSKYRSAITQLLERIRAQDAPSVAEIRSRTGQGAGGEGDMRGLTRGSSLSVAQSAMVDAICLKRAEDIPVYANPGIFSWYSFWEKYTYQSKEHALQDCWHSQVAYWIYEDVVSTIGSLNSGSTKVSQSPIKRLLGVRFDGPIEVSTEDMAEGAFSPRMFGGRGRLGQINTQIDAPVYVKGESIFVGVPWTGRKCDSDIDVVHFAVSVILDSTAVMSFMKELCSAKPHTYFEKFDPGEKQETSSHNQITVLQYHAEPVIRDDIINAYYRYGPDSVVRLNLVCEYLFIRSEAFDVIKPEPIKKMLGQATTDGTPLQ